MRKLTITGSVVDVDVTKWGTVYIDGKDLSSLFEENIEAGNFKAKVSIIIEEVEKPLVIKGNKPQPEPKQIELEDLE